jgi:serine/threonine-protein kinase
MTRRLAEGGMGAVYEAQQFGDQGFQKTVAVKTIPGKLQQQPRIRRLFIGEAKLVADLVHENIVQVYHSRKTGNIYYIALEFRRRHQPRAVHGLSLRPRCAYSHRAGRVHHQPRLPRLEYAHNKKSCDGVSLNIVHRDVPAEECDDQLRGRSQVD